MNNIIQINELSFAYPYSPEREIFSKLNLNFVRGQVTSVMGPSGIGKTTLLRLIGGLLYPTQGEVIVDGQNLHHLSRKLLEQIRKRMSLLFQSSALFTNLSVYDNVAFPLRAHTTLSERMIRQIVLMKLQIVGLRGARDLMPSALSGGMERRVALARALALDPQIIMYDEPFTGLDPISMGVIVKLIKEIHQALGMTSIIVSHDVAEANQISDHIYLISGGNLIGQGKPSEMLQSHEPAIKQFIHGIPDGIVPFHYPARDYTEELFSDA